MELRKRDPRPHSRFKRLLAAKGFGSEWDVWVFDDIVYEAGYRTLEVFHVTPVSARLLDRITVLHGGEIYETQPT